MFRVFQYLPRNPLLVSAKTLLVRKPKDELSRLCRWGPRAYFRESDELVYLAVY
jgi:hypothetical protein